MAEAKTLKKQSFKFKAEVSQLLDILTHSLYTHRNIFIRELISNAADALDKVRLKELLGDKVADPDLNLEIRIDLDKEKKTFTISDTGIGMTKDELVKNIGTIARSGTADFLKQISQEKQDDAQLIGKFGVGFYSVFMAGEKVEITTRSAIQKEPAFMWTSDGRGSFQIIPAEGKIQRGTTIKVFLREDAAEFAESYTVKNTIETYSNFVPFPIILDGDQVNTISAIWREPKSSVKKKQYNEFFKFIAGQNEEPMTWLHFSADVPLQFHALLFVPKNNFENLGFGKKEEGIHLFVKRIMVDAHAKDILPAYLRFVEGVLESDELPLNISRETLQENPYLFKIMNTVVSKFLSYLQDLSEKDDEQYREFWKQFGRILKEGYSDFTHKDKLAPLFRFNSSKCEDGDTLISLQTYVDRMSEKQEEIYFLSGPSREALEKNPTMDLFKAKDIEVLYSFDAIDEFVLPGLMQFQEKNIVSADQSDPGKLEAIQSKEGKKEKKISDADLKDLEKLTRRIKNILGDKVEDVRLSDRLVGSPAVLVGSEKGMSKQMEKIMQMVNQEAAITPKILEINKHHGMIKNLVQIYKANAKDRMLTKIVNNLYDSVLLLDGAVPDPHEMATEMQDLLTETAKLYSQNKPEGEKAGAKKG
ncbi:molecular chaperone HtpG [bacterium]